MVPKSRLRSSAGGPGAAGGGFFDRKDDKPDCERKGEGLL
ncbi:hypothetical protein HMPREF0262_03091 [Clostridium sp. ATCC 29733]|nr:hypothetical protein HMPREF0262_03091 [Clostridium sp. ATCC 29733]